MSKHHSEYIPALSYDWLTPLYDPILRWTMRESVVKRQLVVQAGIEKGQRVLDLGIAGATLLFLNGCMMWMHGNMSGEHGEHRSEQGTTLVKEVQRGDVKITLEAPPLRTGSEAVFRVRLEDLPGGKPVAGAVVDVTMQRKDRHGDSGAHSESKLIEGRAQEGAEKGVFFFRHTFAEHGWYDIVFTARNISGPEGNPVSLVVQKEVEQVLVADAKAHGGTKSTTRYVIGGAMMVVMMLAMIL